MSIVKDTPSLESLGYLDVNELPLKPRKFSSSCERTLATPGASPFPHDSDVEIFTFPPGDHAPGTELPTLIDPSVLPLSKWRELSCLATLCWSSAVMGWNDGSTGPLLLRIEQNYSIGYAVVSLMFVAAFLGYTLGAFLNVHLTDKYGFGKVTAIGAACQVVAYAIMSSAPPFPVFACAFILNGFGVSLLGAQANAFVASLPRSAPKLGLLHAAYGIGAFISPLAATQFAQLPHWSFQYLGSFSMSVVEILSVVLVFRFRTQNDILGISAQDLANARANEGNKYMQIFRLKTVHLLSCFVLVYVGLEVTIGGWIVTYLTEVRGGGPSAGYVSSGFFGGLTVGRVALIWVNEKLGVRRVIFLYSGLAIALEMVTWFVPSLIGDAIAVSFIGLLLGPFYPLIVGACGQILPQWLLAGSIGWIASFGTAGSALFPVITGVLAQKYGIAVLQPLLVAMMVTIIGLWAFTPLSPRRVD